MLKLDTFHIFIFSFVLSYILYNVVVCLTYPILYSRYTFLLYFMLFSSVSGSVCTLGVEGALPEGVRVKTELQ